ncbi:MAG: GGDEF domain-containing protein [Trueperaceae bacterium]
MSDVSSTLSAPSRRRRRSYLLGLAIGLPVMAWVGWQQQDDAFVRIAYPILAAWLIPAGATLWQRPSTLRLVERGTVVLVALAFAGRMAALLAAEPDPDLALTALMPETLVALVLATVFLQLVFTSGTALVLSIGLLGLTATIGLARFGPDPGDAALASLLQMHVYLAVIAMFLWVLARDKEDLAGVQRERDRLRTEAYRDPLTGLPNRRALEEALASELEAAERAGRALAVIPFDLDRFKRINDRYGHPAGDEALIQVARTVRPLLRERDLFGRYGGEEFLILVPHATADEAAALAERCRCAIAAIDLPHGERLSASFGVRAAAPGEGPSDLLREADRLLYRAKRDGRDRVVIDTPAETTVEATVEATVETPSGSLGESPGEIVRQATDAEGSERAG